MHWTIINKNKFNNSASMEMLCKSSQGSEALYCPAIYSNMCNMKVFQHHTEVRWEFLSLIYLKNLLKHHLNKGYHLWPTWFPSSGRWHWTPKGLNISLINVCDFFSARCL